MATEPDDGWHGPRYVTNSIVGQEQLLEALATLGTTVEPDPAAALDDSPLGQLRAACLVLGAAEVQAMNASTAAGQADAIDPWRALDETALITERVTNPTRTISDRAQLAAWYSYRIQRLLHLTEDQMTGTDPITTAAGHAAAALRNLLMASHAQELGAGSVRGQEFLDTAHTELEQVTAALHRF